MPSFDVNLTLSVSVLAVAAENSDQALRIASTDLIMGAVENGWYTIENADVEAVEAAIPLRRDYEREVLPSIARMRKCDADDWKSRANEAVEAIVYLKRIAQAAQTQREDTHNDAERDAIDALLSDMRATHILALTEGGLGIDAENATEMTDDVYGKAIMLTPVTVRQGPWRLEWEGGRLGDIYHDAAADSPLDCVEVAPYDWDRDCLSYEPDRSDLLEALRDYIRSSDADYVLRLR